MVSTDEDPAKVDVKFNYSNVQRWTRCVDIFTLKWILIPIHLMESHWVLIAVNFFNKQIFYFDSMNIEQGLMYIDTTKYYVKHEHIDKHGSFPATYWKDWTIYQRASKQQTNGCDCGVFVLMNSWCVLNNVPLSYARQHNMHSFRKYIALSIMEKKLLPAL